MTYLLCALPEAAAFTHPAKGLYFKIAGQMKWQTELCRAHVMLFPKLNTIGVVETLVIRVPGYRQLGNRCGGTCAACRTLGPSPCSP